MPHLGENRSVKQPVFTLEEVTTGMTKWIREGNWGIDQASELFISDEGWSVIRFNDTSTYARLLVISPQGEEVLTVGVSSIVIPRIVEPPVSGGKWVLWLDEHVEHWTIGVIWTRGSRFRFARNGNQHLFVCRTGWGRYLVLDFTGARVVSEDEASPELLALLRPVDQQWALGILEKVRLQRVELETAIENRDGVVLSPPAMDELCDDLEIALQIVRQDRVKKAAEYLVELQDFGGPLYESPIRVAKVGEYDEFQCDQVRKWNHLAMLAVGIKPRGHSIIYFSQSEGGKGSPFLELPDCIADREQILKTLKLGMGPHEVVHGTGAPNAILEPYYLGDSIPGDEEFSYERWDFDELDSDGAPVSWGLLWRKSKGENVRNSNAGPWSHPFKFKTADECSPELVSVTRLEWTEAYRRMREEDHPM